MKNDQFIAVKTTKIYCLPTCPARAPLPQNVVYFKTAAQAENHGFRPCKRCFPDFPYGKWIDDGASVLLMGPSEFDYWQCLKFLDRSPLEPCHRIENGALFKLVKFEGEPVLLKIQYRESHTIRIDFLTGRPKKSIRAQVAKYVWHWFDLETDLRPFYRMAGRDPVLKDISKNLYGLRILTISDLFEAICWAIIGQQINLTFAYTLKKRLMEAFGEGTNFENRRFYLFPTPRALAQKNAADLRILQLTWKKSEYIIELAQKMVSGEVTKKRLLEHADFDKARKELMRLHGIGRWTADYVSLRCLKDPAALPVADVGLQNAVKQQLGLSKKPTAEDMAGYSEGWHDWQAYACFYLWASLISKAGF